MDFIFCDESGDLGFSGGSSKFFVVALLETSSPFILERCMKRTRKKLKRKLADLPELKFNKSKPETREFALREISKQDVHVHYLVLEKATVAGKLQGVKERLFNYVAALLLAEALNDSAPRTLIVDSRSTNRLIREDFNQYVQKQRKERFLGELKVEHRRSLDDKGLQAVDFVAGAIFGKYEHGNERYYRLIEGKVRTTKRLFKK